MHGQVRLGFQSEQTFWDIHKENSRKPEHNIVIMYNNYLLINLIYNYLLICNIIKQCSRALG